MYTSDLIAEIVRRFNVSKNNAALFVDTAFVSILDTIKRGERVELLNFGNFSMREYRSYTGSNPKYSSPQVFDQL